MSILRRSLSGTLSASDYNGKYSSDDSVLDGSTLEVLVVSVWHTYHHCPAVR